jgi:hypothetical protein
MPNVPQSMVVCGSNFVISDSMSLFSFIRICFVVNDAPRYRFRSVVGFSDLEAQTSIDAAF